MFGEILSPCHNGISFSRGKKDLCVPFLENNLQRRDKNIHPLQAFIENLIENGTSLTPFLLTGTKAEQFLGCMSRTCGYFPEGQ